MGKELARNMVNENKGNQGSLTPIKNNNNEISQWIKSTRGYLKAT